MPEHTKIILRQNIHDFDALEIHPCAVVKRDNDGTEHVEPCRPEQADFWTVYGHCRSGGVDALEDFATRGEAVAFGERLMAAYPHLDTRARWPEAREEPERDGTRESVERGMDRG